MAGPSVNPALIRELQTAPPLLSALLNAAQGIAREASALGRSEAYDPDDQGEHYAEQITATLSRDGHDQPVGQVLAGKFTSNWIENGFHDRSGTWHEGKHILSRAADTAGRHNEPEEADR